MNKLLKIGVLVAQLCLGIVFLFSGFTKVIDPIGSGIKMEDYFLAFGLDLPQSLIQTVAVVQAILEFILGAWVLLGIWKKTAGWLMLLFMLAMTPFTLYLAIANPVSDCGCFGEAIILTNWETFIKNIVLLAASIMYVRYNSSVMSFFGRRTGRWCTYWCLLFSVFLTIHSYRHQPLIDFMPFKTGNDLNVLVHVPPTAVTDSFTYRFLYEKDGVKAAFTADDLPESGSGWTYVDRTQKLVREGEKPVIEQFNIIHPRLGDVTESILNDTSYVFLFVSPKLETSQRRFVGRAVDAWEYARMHNYTFYGITGSDESFIKEWLYEYDTDFEFCSMEDRLLSTMIRSNPGLILIKGGVVYRKWASRDIPDFSVIKEPLADITIGKERHASNLRLFGLSLLGFMLPLLFFYLLRTGRLTHLKRSLNLN